MIRPEHLITIVLLIAAIVIIVQGIKALENHNG